MQKENFILFSGGTKGTEAAFGENAEKFGLIEVNFTFEGHKNARTRGLRVLNPKELVLGDVNLEYVSRLMNRRYTEGPLLRKIFQTIWYQVTTGQQVFIVGDIQSDNTVKGGTGWAAELAKITNKPLHVFDQEKDSWFRWGEDTWVKCEELPTIESEHFTGTGTRILEENGRKAICELFERSFS